MIFGYNEDLLQFIWEYQLYKAASLITTDGTAIQIIKQGYLNRSNGPDFERAEIRIANTTHHGSVEIHVDSREWEQHGHHEDLAFNTVVLHVCYSVSKESYRQDGTKIPTIAIGQFINQSALHKYQELMANKAFVPCERQLTNLSSFDINIWLDRMIVERLEARCTLFRTYLTSSNDNWNQAFFTAIVRSFGMPANTEAFEEIAQQMTYDLVQKHHQSLFQLEALFFGVAGLLEEPKEDNYYTGLKSEWGFLKAKYTLSSITTKLKTGRMRPLNLPTVKLAQLAAFFHHVPQFIPHVLKLPPVKSVKEMLDFSLSDYWDTHYTFNKSSDKKSKSISSGFVNHLFLNAIVPFVFFYEKEKMDTATDKALNYLHSIPSEKNSIISKWKSSGIESNNALTSQALLHLHKTYCTPQRCLECSIGKKLLLN
tara:strand:+ start:46 stop:1323 length:1278 start_codon:yes stop_codon:yes gene_type:complete